MARGDYGHLVKYGTIDARTVLHTGTTDAHKMFTRLRCQGYLYRADNSRGTYWYPTAPVKAAFGCTTGRLSGRENDARRYVEV